MITVSLPPYQRPREKWRKEIHRTVLQAARDGGTRYSAEGYLEVVVLLYLGKRDSKKRLLIHDVDNRLKDILDALQGRFGRSSSHDRLCVNDNRVRRVVMEKQLTPKHLGDGYGGRLMIRPYRQHRWPLQASKGHGLRRSTR
jgi:Holliday junction resolvase RusA-like endonuclease